MHTRQIITSGKKTGEASKVLIMLHGRGGTAEDILGLSSYLAVSDFALVAPQATNHTWYPYSFMAPPRENEPWLSSAVSLVNEIVNDTKAKGVDTSNIYLLGFSQGACLMLEAVTRQATRYGGLIAFTGGLIGDKLYMENYAGDFSGTPVFIGTSDPDPHVPVERVNASAAVLTGMHASVTKKIYRNMGHTISADEIEQVNSIFFNNH